MKKQTKIKIFYRERIEVEDDFGSTRWETTEELEARVNQFMTNKSVIDIKYQVATHGNYENMGTHVSIVVMYEELTD